MKIIPRKQIGVFEIYERVRPKRHCGSLLKWVVFDHAHFQCGEFRLMTSAVKFCREHHIAHAMGLYNP